MLLPFLSVMPKSTWLKRKKLSEVFYSLLRCFFKLRDVPEISLPYTDHFSR